MNWNSVRPWFGAVVRLVLGVVWLWASLGKLANPRHFVEAVRAYDATPEWLSKAMGYGMPVLELALAVLLIVGVAVRLSAAVSAVLMLVFLIGVIQASARGLRLSCGCFGGGGQTLGATHYLIDILRDLVLLAAAVFLVLWPATKVSIEAFLGRNDSVELPSAKRMRTPEGSRKYQAAVEAKEKAARDRARYLNSSLAIIVALVAFIGIGVQADRAKISGDTTASNATVANGVVWGGKAAATVDVFEDFQCPHCLEFEQATHSVLEADVRANTAQVRYHTMSFLDSATGANKYSSRAANAALCVSDVSTDAFVKFHDVLFSPAVQPAEGSNGRTDAQLVSYAQQAGLTSDQITAFTACLQKKTHAQLVEAITENSSKRGVSSTPTVWVNGKKLSTTDLAHLTAAIAAADAKGPKPSPSPSTLSVSSTPTVPTTTIPAATPTPSRTPTSTPTSSPTSTG